jgi:hypothetical protein
MGELVMTAHDLSIALAGGILLGYLVIALFFLRFWRQTRARLFLCFAVAFLILAFERLMLLAGPTELVHLPLFYGTRLIAFLVIAWAIWDQNRLRS